MIQIQFRLDPDKNNCNVTQSKANQKYERRVLMIEHFFHCGIKSTELLKGIIVFLRGRMTLWQFHAGFEQDLKMRSSKVHWYKNIKFCCCYKRYNCDLFKMCVKISSLWKAKVKF